MNLSGIYEGIIQIIEFFVKVIVSTLYTTYYFLDNLFEKIQEELERILPW